MNSYLKELSSIVPMCTVLSSQNKKLDKLTILKLTAQHLKSIKGCETSKREEVQTFFSSNDLRHFSYNMIDGFSMVIGCKRGEIFFVSKSVETILNYSNTELEGQNLFEFLHPNDLNLVKEQVLHRGNFPKPFNPEESVNNLSCENWNLWPGDRRSFFCRFKINREIACLSNEGTYQIVHCTGYLRIFGISNSNNEDDESSNKSCLLMVVRKKESEETKNSLGFLYQSPQFYVKQSTNGKFTFADLSVFEVLGYLPQELIGSSYYELCHQDDVPNLTEIYEQASSKPNSPIVKVLRIRKRSGEYVHLKTKTIRVENSYSKIVEFLITTNSLASIDNFESDTSTINEGCAINDKRHESTIVGLGLGCEIVENITGTKSNSENKDEINSTLEKVMDLEENDTYFDGIQNLMDASW
ncbi:DgyrCDS2013 [Dimorphilus gyrociliatus]|nr:DgyrCDS2013 [Dimorphilus gyrociliatus]